MKIQKLSDPRLLISKLDDFIKTRYDLPPTIAHPHFISTVYAGRGSGKTTTFINLWNNFYKSIFKKLFIISPTLRNDDKMLKILHGPDGKPASNVFVFNSFDDDIDLVMDTINHENDLFNHAKGLLKTTLEIIKSGQQVYDPVGLSRQLDTCLEILKKGEPCSLLYVDDSIGARRLASGKKADAFNNFITTHRWLKVSIFVCSQEYKGVNTALRANASQVILFKSKDSEVKKVCDEVGRDLDKLYARFINSKSKPYEFVAINFDTSTMSYMLDTVVEIE
jgi:hypothetical protein